MSDKLASRTFFLEILKVLAIFVAGVFALWRYYDTTANEFQKPLWEHETELLFEISEVTATIASQENTKERADALSRFWVLYYGPLCVVENDDLRKGMVAFGTELAGAQRRDALQTHSLQVAQACREQADNLLRAKRQIFDVPKARIPVPQADERNGAVRSAGDPKRPIGSDKQKEPLSASIRPTTVASDVDYTNGDVVRGGQLYDDLFRGTQAVPPTRLHPLWASKKPVSERDSWRCSECHGWDYGQLRSKQFDVRQVGEILLAPNGHAYGELLTAKDIADLSQFVVHGTLDISTLLSEGRFKGNLREGRLLFDRGFQEGIQACQDCHGGEGRRRANVGRAVCADPWRFQHKVRFGQADNDMPHLYSTEMDMNKLRDLGAHVQVLGGCSPRN